MNTLEKEYSVKQLAKMAGVTVKTLHHYDKLGLLQPAFRSSSGYRFYKGEQILRLQQILFYRELEFSLKEIKTILSAPEFSLLQSLEFQRKALANRVDRTLGLLETIDNTIASIRRSKEYEMNVSDLYQGFEAKEAESIRAEAIERWGAKSVKRSETRIRSLGKDGYAEHQKEGKAIYAKLAECIHLPPESARTQELIRQFHEHQRFYWNVDNQGLLGLANLYQQDPRFSRYFEDFACGLADYLADAIVVYCKEALS
ncbi:MerR family transcriptional regulator [Aliikangiella sp. G2MR2-5]|uniref:MerR family transcriptional regulator n=1 Tax=Aliikangiella sp. G2MR2-5 TaxID=2788943 RepID=UPI0018ABA6DE|nr:MerR family transcriptional regulator [Aliikangiella sp. G2MR2-5]